MPGFHKRIGYFVRSEAVRRNFDVLHGSADGSLNEFNSFRRGRKRHLYRYFRMGLWQIRA
jgi:hypothetical protein